MLNSYLDLNFDVFHDATDDRYVDGDDISLVILAPSALFSEYKFTTSSGKHLDNIDHAHIVSLSYKLLTSSRGSDDLSIGFDLSRDRRKRELTNNKKRKGKNHLRIYLKDVSGFAEHQETGTHGLSYKLTLKRNTNAVSNKDNATNKAKIKLIGIEWWVSHYSSSLKEYNKLLSQVTRRTPTNLHYTEISVFMKEVNIQNFWSFELGTQEGINVHVWIFRVFQQNDRQHDQNLNNHTFYSMPVTSAQCIIGTEKYPDSGILLNYTDNNYSQGYGQI